MDSADDFLGLVHDVSRAASEGVVTFSPRETLIAENDLIIDNAIKDNQLTSAQAASCSYFRPHPHMLLSAAAAVWTINFVLRHLTCMLISQILGFGLLVVLYVCMLASRFGMPHYSWLGLQEWFLAPPPRLQH